MAARRVSQLRRRADWKRRLETQTRAPPENRFRFGRVRHYQTAHSGRRERRIRRLEGRSLVGFSDDSKRPRYAALPGAGGRDAHGAMVLLDPSIRRRREADGGGNAAVSYAVARARPPRTAAVSIPQQRRRSAGQRHLYFP